jgi:hypothetical protein
VADPQHLATALTADDAGFVRAPIELVYRRLTHIALWPTWWRGLRLEPRAPVGGEESWALELRGSVGRRLRLRATATGWRLHAGMVLRVAGDLDGTSEFWLESTRGGTVVHNVLLATTPLPRPDRVLEDHRRAIRRGLWGLKDALQVESRTSAGLLP